MSRGDERAAGRSLPPRGRQGCWSPRRRHVSRLGPPPKRRLGGRGGGRVAAAAGPCGAPTLPRALGHPPRPQAIPSLRGPVRPRHPRGHPKASGRSHGGRGSPLERGDCGGGQGRPRPQRRRGVQARAALGRETITRGPRGGGRDYQEIQSGREAHAAALGFVRRPRGAHRALLPVLDPRALDAGPPRSGQGEASRVGDLPRRRPQTRALSRAPGRPRHPSRHASRRGGVGWDGPGARCLGGGPWHGAARCQAGGARGLRGPRAQDGIRRPSRKDPVEKRQR
mmetsp:Transcript_43363/g.98012  ORF Transcript_43363/g.98012 Transcript_43363/m.98012 type:complete len:282 (+) Transcript_43363:1115-1960(+)